MYKLEKWLKIIYQKRKRWKRKLRRIKKVIIYLPLRKSRKKK